MNRAVNFLVTGGIAGLAMWASTKLDILAWVVFLAWVGCALLRASTAAAAKVFGSFVVGVAAGCIVGQVAATAQELGSLALPLALSAMVGIIALLEDFPPLDAVPIYFMGMVAFFASGNPPAPATVFTMAIPAFLGVTCGWLCARMRGRVADRCVPGAKK